MDRPLLRHHPLMLSELQSGIFEYVCRDIWWEIIKSERPEKFGVSGNKQSGVDLIVRRGDGKLSLGSCKNYKKFTKGNLKKTIDQIAPYLEFWKNLGADTFRIFIGCSKENAKMQTALIEYTRSFETQGIKLDLWDNNDLTIEIRKYPQIGAKYFDSRIQSELYDSPSAGLKKRHHLIPFRPNPYFTGRTSEMDQLKERFSANRVAAVIVGEGGVGKTQLACSFAHECSEQFSHVLWLNAESAQTMEQDFTGLVTELSLSYGGGPTSGQALSLLHGWLERESNWLLIADNVDTVAARDFLMASFHPGLPGAMLITSKRTDWPTTFLPVVPHLFLDDEGGRFIVERGRRPEAELGDARSLSRNLSGVPLALEAAAAWLFKKRASCARYFERLRDTPDALADIVPGATNYEKTIASTWFVNLGEISASAVCMLEILSVISPDPITPEEMFRLVASIRQNLFTSLAQVECCMDELAELSFVQMESSGVYQHRLKQLVMRRRLASKGRLNDLATQCIQILAELLRNAQKNDFSSKRQLAAHLDTSLYHASVLNIAAASIAGANETLREYYLEVDAAESHKETALREYEATQPDTSQRASAATNLGGAYWKLARRRIRRKEFVSSLTLELERAESLFREALLLKAKISPDDLQMQAESHSNLAHVLRDQERFKEAEAHCDKAIDFQNNVSPPDKSKSAIRYANRGILYTRMFEERLGDNFGDLAETDLKTSLDLSLARTHHRDERTVRSYVSLGNLYILKGMPREALPLIENAWSLGREVYGSIPGKNPPSST